MSESLADRILLAVNHEGPCGLRVKAFGDFKIENRLNESCREITVEADRLVDAGLLAFQGLPSQTLYLLTDAGRTRCDELIRRAKQGSSPYFVS